MDWQSARGSRRAQFKNAPRLLCGPELRTRQTAELFGSHAEVVAALRDCDVGRWSGQRINDLQNPKRNGCSPGSPTRLRRPTVASR
jgi:broad specificity phosphatase PhoE